MELTITFPGGKKVDAALAGQVIRTDQPPQNGGEGSAPEPFALFAAAIGTCAGFYALTFCQSRAIATEGLAIRERLRFEQAHGLASIELDVELPSGFPDKYCDALLRAIEGCAVKKAIEAQPKIVVRLLAELT